MDRFEQLKPYNPEVVKGPVLEVESENYPDGECRQLYCLAFSAKRYALYTVDKKGELEEVVKASPHGLGHLLPPTEEPPGGKHWTDAVLDLPHPEGTRGRGGGTRVVRSARRGPDHDELPQLLEAFDQDGIPYADQLKPFNFLLSVPVARCGYPEGVDASRFSLIAPYESDPERWTNMRWIDKYSGIPYPVSTTFTPSPWIDCVKTFGQVVQEYWSHAQPKTAVPEGGRCERLARGLLGRRQVHVLQVQNVGKESNQLDQVDAGLISDWGEVREEYGSGDPLWEDHVIPVLKQVSSATLEWETGLSERTIRALRNGHRAPIPESRTKILQVFRQLLDDSFEFR